MDSKVRILFLIACEASKEVHDISASSISTLENSQNITVDILYANSENNEPVFVYNAYINIKKINEYDYVFIMRDTVCIAEELLIKKVIAIFSSDPKLGVLGIKGYLTVDNKNKYDNVYGGYYQYDINGEINLVQYNQPCDTYINVESITGNFIVFRGDIPIKYNVDMNILAEIISAAAMMQDYKVGVPKQEKFWCLEFDKNYKHAENANMYIIKEFQIAKYAVKQKSPLLTIGIPTFNRSKYLSKCLEAIYNQVGNCSFIEILVSDNASTDDTSIVVNNYRKFKNLRYVCQEKNIGAERNVLYLYENAKGKYVVVCGDDDYYYYGAIMRIIEAIHDYPNTALIALSWWGNFNEIRCGDGIDNFLYTCTHVCTSISSVALNREYYNEIINKNKFGHTNLNQVYVQLAMLSKHKQYCYLSGNNFNPDSGEASIRVKGGFKLEKRVDFCKIFLDQHYEILNYFLGKGLSVRGLSKEKARNADKVIAWLQYIAEQQDRSQWRIDDNMEEIFKKHYSKEPYYDKLVGMLKSIRETDNIYKKEKGLL